MARGITVVFVLGALAIGFFMLGRMSVPEFDTGKTVIAQSELEDLEARAADSESQLATLRGERDLACEERDTSIAQLAEATSELATARAELAKLEEAARRLHADEASAIPVVFGKWDEVAGVRNANWDEMSEAVEQINGLIKNAIDREAAGEPVPQMELQKQIMPWNSRLVRYLGSVSGDLPTNSAVNGEYTHPITLANLMVQMLERVELPVTDAQYDAIVGLGEEYDREYTRLQKSYDKTTLQLDRVVDELALKADTMFNMENVLTAEQRNAIIVPEIHNRAFLDTRSPVLMVMLTVNPVPALNAQSIRDMAPLGYAQHFGVSQDDLSEHAELFDTWYKEVSFLLEVPVEPEEARFYTLEQALIAGRAHSHVVNTLLADLELSDAVVARVRADPAWSLPLVRLAGEEE